MGCDDDLPSLLHSPQGLDYRLVDEGAIEVVFRLIDHERVWALREQENPKQDRCLLTQREPFKRSNDLFPVLIDRERYIWAVAATERFKLKDLLRVGSKRTDELLCLCRPREEGAALVVTQIEDACNVGFSEIRSEIDRMQLSAQLRDSVAA